MRALDPAALQRELTSAGTAFEVVRDGSVVVELADERAIAELVSRLAQAGVAPTGIVPEGSGLESAFLRLGASDR